VPPAETTALSAAEPEPEESHSRAGWWVAAGLLLLLLIAAAAFLLPRLFESPPEQVRVPQLIGLSEADARAAIGDAELTVGEVTYEDSSDVKRDEVISQDPEQDTYVSPGDTVDFVVSSGKPKVEVPSVIGMKKNAARQTLVNLKFNVVLQEKEADDPAGQVVETDPAAGEQVPEGSTVTVYYSDGPEVVPNVVGKQQDAATTILENAGFTVKVFTNGDPTDQPTGTVLEQTPDAGTEQPAGTQIVLIVTTYVAPTESPSPTDSPSASPSP
jgi:beta-lactam-binding protein with PASTA domain